MVNDLTSTDKKEKKSFQSPFTLDYGQILTQNNFDSLLRLQTNVWPDVVRMGEIKQRQDVAATLMGERGFGPEHLKASKFHFLMRQYRFGITEAIRYFIEYLELCHKEKQTTRMIFSCYFKGLNYKLERLKIAQAKHDKEPELFNQLTRNEIYEECRQELIFLNDGKIFTNQQFQEEYPEYYQFLFTQRFLFEMLSNITGYSKGLLESHEKQTRIPLIQDKTIRSLIPIIDIPTAKLNKENVARYMSQGDTEIESQYISLIDRCEELNMSRFPLHFRETLQKIIDNKNNFSSLPNTIEKLPGTSEGS